MIAAKLPLASSASLRSSGSISLQTTTLLTTTILGSCSGKRRGFPLFPPIPRLLLTTSPVSSRLLETARSLSLQSSGSMFALQFPVGAAAPHQHSVHPAAASPLFPAAQCGSGAQGHNIKDRRSSSSSSSSIRARLHGLCFSSSTSSSSSSSSSSVSEPKYILGIETSCDDTGAAVVSTDGQILGEALATQGTIHAQWGGVVPSLARTAHEEAIDGVVEQALSQAGLSESDLSAVAVTLGPGLSLCLRVGVVKARSISRQHRLPLIAVHHMEAHALMARLTESSAVDFPFLVLLVSGGHNLLLIAHSVGRYTELGATLDDALGEAFDKTARVLGLDLSSGGGPALERLAAQGDPFKYPFKVPMRDIKSLDFSYAGLKSAVARTVQQVLPGAESCPLERAAADDVQMRADIAASFQHTAVAHLQQRTSAAIKAALELEPSIKCLVLSGGVAANKIVRSRIQEAADEAGLRLVCPPPRLCTDNGVMVAWVGVERFRLGLIEAPPPMDEPEDFHVELRPRWPLASPREPYAPRSSKKKGMFTPLSSMPQL